MTTGGWTSSAELRGEAMESTSTAVLIDLDHLSYGGHDVRCTDEAMRSTIHAVGDFLRHAGCDIYYTRGACSTATADHHWRVLVDAAANSWTACRGRDGADHEILSDL